MQDAIGEFIDGRESDTGSDPKPVDRDPGGADESFGETGGDSYTARVGSFPKLTKSGKIDKRTLRGPRGASGSGSDTSATSAEKSKVHLSKLDIGELLFSIHLTLSEFTGWEELQLEKEESRELGDAVKEYAKFYGLSFDPKKVALFNLCLVAGKLYIPRAIAVKNRLSQPSTKGPKLVPAPQQPQNLNLNGMAPSDLWQEGAAL
jgi:hypothetical protein